MSNPSPSTRKAIYRSASAVVVLLVFYKVLTADEAAAYVQALGILLGLVPTELAARNVPKVEKRKCRVLPDRGAE